MKNKTFLLLCVTSLGLSLITSACAGRKRRGDDDQEDPTKANITVGTLDKGIGTAWLENAAKEFEELYKDATNFQEGRVGVKVSVKGSTQYNGSYLETASLNHDIYFTEGIAYRELSKKGKFMDITSIVNEKLTDYSENKTIMEKIDSTMADFLTVDNKVYGIPFYDSFYGMVYDIDLWNEQKLYLSKGGQFVNKSGDLSLGTDNQAGTLDDGLPSTYEEFDKLIKKMLDKGIIPYLASQRGIEYTANYLYNVFADYEGLDNMKQNITLSGTSTDLVDTIAEDGAITYKPATAISEDNGYELQRQVGRYKTLKFFNDVLVNNPNNYNQKLEATHTGAQSSFINGHQLGKPIGMLIEGSWWENEAKHAFETYIDTYGADQRHNYAIMPIPFENAEKAAACNYKHTYLSLSQSFGIVSNSAKNKDLALEFMKFLHTDKMLSAFTRDTSITRPLNYEISEADQANLTTYAKSLIDLKKNSNVFYPYSSNQFQIDNNLYFNAFNWTWNTTINGTTYRHPWMYFTTVKNPSVTAYFDGQYTYFRNLWSSLQR